MTCGPFSSKIAAFAVLIVAGCSEQPATEASRHAAIEAKSSSEKLAAQVGAENTRRAQQHAELLATVERAKGEAFPSRVPELAQGDSFEEKSNHVAVRVWACSCAEADRQSAVVAEMTGRQLLLLARGASVAVGDGGLRINSTATIPGVRVTEKKQTGGYTVVQLDASMKILEPTGMQRLQSESFTVPLHEVIASISQSVEDSIHRHRETHPAATNGFLILRKMELLPGKHTPECRYQLDVYAGEP